VIFSRSIRTIVFFLDNLYSVIVVNAYGLLFLMAALDNLEQSELTTTRAAI